MKISVLQSSDPYNYIEMYNVTNVATREYCRRHNLRAEFYIGIKRGYLAWHATYNRIIMIKELMDRGYDGWVVWLDADAFINDLSFDIRSYLEGKKDKSLIVVNSGATPANWDVNIGVMMLNLGRQFGQLLAYSWYSQFMNITEEQLNQAYEWGSVPDDQVMVQWHLQKQNDISSEVFHEEWSLINSSFASFIRQVMREEEQDFQKRLLKIKGQIDKVLSF